MIEHIDKDKSLTVPKATRVEIIDAHGRVFTGHYVAGMSIEVQDQGRTIKVFAKEVRPFQTAAFDSGYDWKPGANISPDNSD